MKIAFFDTKPCDKAEAASGFDGACSFANDTPNGINSSRSHLLQWPCKLNLVPRIAPYFDNADLLIAADCAAYICKNFHSDFMRERVTLTVCPRLNNEEYLQKLTDIIVLNDIKTITSVQIDACRCYETEKNIKLAITKSGKSISYQSICVSTDGEITDVKKIY